MAKDCESLYRPIFIVPFLLLAASYSLVNLSASKPVNAYILQIIILTNHMNGKDTHVRGMRIFGPVEYVRTINSLFSVGQYDPFHAHAVWCFISF